MILRHSGKPGRVALIVSEANRGRLSEGLRGYVNADRDYWAIGIDEPIPRIVERLGAWRAVGAIMEYREDLAEVVTGMGIQVVLLMADLLMEGVGCVNVNDHEVGELAARYYLERRYSNFGFVGREILHAPERRMGYAELLQQSGCEVSILEIAESGNRSRNEDDHNRRVEGWLGSLKRPVGIFVGHDELGREVVDACWRLGVRIPEDVAILSVSDDPYSCELVYPGMSHVEIPWKTVGAKAGELMEQLLSGEPAREAVLVSPQGIHTRGSSEIVLAGNPRIQRVIRLMRENLAAEIGIDVISKAAGIDRRAIERLFRKELRRSPLVIWTQIRVERARELLDQTNLRISEVANQTGFITTDRMARAFRERYGCTPQQYLRANPRRVCE